MPGLKTLHQIHFLNYPQVYELCPYCTILFSHLLQVPVNTGYKTKKELNSKFLGQNRKPSYCVLQTTKY